MKLRKKVSGSTYYLLIELRRSISGSIVPVEFKFSIGKHISSDGSYSRVLVEALICRD